MKVQLQLKLKNEKAMQEEERVAAGSSRVLCMGIFLILALHRQFCWPYCIIGSMTPIRQEKCDKNKWDVCCLTTTSRIIHLGNTENQKKHPRKLLEWRRLSSFFLKTIYFRFLFVSVLPAYWMHVQHMHAWCPCKAEEDISWNQSCKWF